MTIEERVDASGNTYLSLTECPVPGCDETFSRQDGGARTRHFLHDHGPADLGDDPRASPEGSA